MTKEQALDRLRAKCSRAEYCSGQIASTLKRWKYEGDIAEIVSTLVAEKFVDDARFANAFVRDKLKFNGWGRQKIVYKLRSLAVPSVIIEAALKENYYSSPDGEFYGAENGNERDCGGGHVNADKLSGYKVLEKLLERKWNSLKKDEPLQNRKAKAVRFAMSRGFDYEDVIKIVHRLSID